ncbi:hypothetical protein SUGI_0678490 [Cryptomeria japonica]|uniref:LOB domain-containing protein 1-like n=1 Tax=Cryptomeria japonica TaxID=3369 RepID=UPI0024149C63|nr:LOB domain-containing protein 1-like [Cryptomeria japonica]GLJ33755.1 hypothetical protein SUGI_0678490 [Cryptomeria japonica]
MNVPCGACRAQRKKCSEGCLLAPHFPPDDPVKFAIVHKVFGTRNIIKLLQLVEADQRGDTVSSMLYEASARLNDPIYGCTAEVYQLQKEIAQLESQLVTTMLELNQMRSEYGKLVFLLGTGSLDGQLVYPTDAISPPGEYIMYEEVDPLLSWGPLWEL